MVVVGSNVCFVVVLSLLAGGSGGGCRFRRLLCRGVNFVGRWIW